MKTMFPISPTSLLPDSDLILPKCNANLCEAQGKKAVVPNVSKLSVSSKGKMAE
jgi:hypothetical protein